MKGKWFNVYKHSLFGAGDPVVTFYCPFCHEWHSASNFPGVTDVCDRMEDEIEIVGLSSHLYFHGDKEIVGAFFVEDGHVTDSWGDVIARNGDHTPPHPLHYL